MRFKAFRICSSVLEIIVIILYGFDFAGGLPACGCARSTRLPKFATDSGVAAIAEFSQLKRKRLATFGLFQGRHQLIQTEFRRNLRTKGQRSTGA